MALWDKLRGELVDIIEWLDDSRDAMVWRFPRYEGDRGQFEHAIFRARPGVGPGIAHPAERFGETDRPVRLVNEL